MPAAESFIRQCCEGVKQGDRGKRERIRDGRRRASLTRPKKKKKESRGRLRSRGMTRDAARALRAAIERFHFGDNVGGAGKYALNYYERRSIATTHYWHNNNLTCICLAGKSAMVTQCDIYESSKSH